MEYFSLNDGNRIPKIGTGTNTFGKENNDYMGKINGDYTPLVSALKSGYRLIDTAVSYRNEAVVGAGIKASGVKRADIFLTSKIPGQPEFTATDEKVHQTVSASLERLGTNYLDLYLIHHPWDDLDDIVRVWHDLEQEVDDGRIKSIGVSNFDETELGYLLARARIKPVVDQIESNPASWNNGIIEFAKKNNVVPEAWSPVKNVPDSIKKLLTEIGMRHRKTWSQVLLRYQIQRGVVVIPKSHNPLHQKENLDIFDFVLTDDDVATIAEAK